MDPLRIALISPVWFPVPPTGYGGIEWIVWLLADGLVEAGHDVTLFASGDSRTKAKLAYVYERAPSALIGTSIVEIHHCLACFERADEFDVINDHSGLPAAAIGGAVSTPTSNGSTRCARAWATCSGAGSSCPSGSTPSSTR